MEPYIIAISGPTAAGKTFFTRRLIHAMNNAELSTVKISTDEFYHDLSHLTMEERNQVNYDLPASIDDKAFELTLNQLAKGNTTEVPVYDFTTHTRKDITRTIEPADLIIIEGIFSLSFETINEYYDLRIFIDLDPDLRLIRRVRRDMEERGRELESVFNQYLNQVKPTQERMVQHDQRKADMTIMGNKDHHRIFDLLIAAIRNRE